MLMGGATVGDNRSKLTSLCFPIIDGAACSAILLPFLLSAGSVLGGIHGVRARYIMLTVDVSCLAYFHCRSVPLRPRQPAKLKPLYDPQLTNMVAAKIAAVDFNKT